MGKGLEIYKGHSPPMRGVFPSLGPDKTGWISIIITTQESHPKIEQGSDCQARHPPTLGRERGAWLNPCNFTPSPKGGGHDGERYVRIWKLSNWGYMY